MSEQTTIETPTEVLNDFLTRAFDAEKGYGLAAETTNHESLKDFLAKNSKQRG